VEKGTGATRERDIERNDDSLERARMAWRAANA